MAKRPPAKKSSGPRRSPRNNGRDDDDAPPAKKRKAAWPFVLSMLVIWGAIFGAIFWSHFLSELPDVKNLLTSGPSRDVTILDTHGRLIARRGLTQGAMIKSADLPDYVPNAFIAIEDRRFR